MEKYGEMLGYSDLEYFDNNSQSIEKTFITTDNILNINDNIKQLYKDFDEYFNNPTLTKIKNVNGYSMYMVKTVCLLGLGCRYIIVFVQQDNNPLKTRQELISLQWKTLQTRTLQDRHDISSHGYQPIKKTPLSAHITRTNSTEKESLYSCEDFPLTVTLLHTKPGKNEYSEKGNIIAALETYSTIVTLT